MVSLFYTAIAAVLVLAALQWRRRIMQCIIVHSTGASRDPACLTLAATGVSISESMRRSACCCALTYDIDVLDLVPADLPAEELLALLQLYNPARYRSNRITGAVSAGHVVLVSESIARRAGLQKQELLPEAEFSLTSAVLKNSRPAGLTLPSRRNFRQ